MKMGLGTRVGQRWHPVVFHHGAGEKYVKKRHDPRLSLDDLHCNENPIYVFPEKEMRGLSPKCLGDLSVSAALCNLCRIP
jgi:hypothetical protein